MNRLPLLFAFFIISFPSVAQKTVRIRNLYAAPQVHVLFEGYTVSFTIKDINRALELLSGNGISSYGSTSGLDTAKDHYVELFSGYRQQYHSTTQPMLQLGVGAFLLIKGRALIENPKHRKLKTITVDIQPLVEGENETDVKFYDPGTGKLIFNGRLHESMKNADLGIDYW